MTRTGFRIGSTRKDVELNCYKWIPDGDVRAVLFISHGMMEHILRYDAFAEYLNGFNIAVYGHDHMGHGETAAHGGMFGYTVDFSQRRTGMRFLSTISTRSVRRSRPIFPAFLGSSWGTAWVHSSQGVS